MDIDGTISIDSKIPYEEREPNIGIVNKLLIYKQQGFKIVLFTSRNMNTYKGNIGKINATTLPKLINWLKKHRVPYDEIWMGKPWCGKEGFYVDDKAIRPSEFEKMSHEEIKDMLKNENSYETV